MGIYKISAPFQEHFFEIKAKNEKKLICGIDEVGRGSLAGPVVAAAVVIKPFDLWTDPIPFIADSKLLTKKERCVAFDWIVKNSWYGLGMQHHRIIDSYSIYMATVRAMERAVIQLIIAHPQLYIELILIDAMPIPVDFLWKIDNQYMMHQSSLFDYPWQKVIYFIKGETYSFHIAAASIVAKVFRDRLMEQFATFVPQYSFQVHRGYGTKLHCSYIAEHGPSIIHRMSFIH